MAKKAESWLPLPFSQLPEEVDRLFDELIHRPWGARLVAEDWSPQLDLYETEDAFILEADLPGVKKPDVSVTVEAGELVLQGRRSAERTETEGNFHYRERRSGHFVRRLRLPASVDAEQIRADFRNGVLRVTLPKLGRERKPQR
ncbi:MAG TPA: Hsp20/alpha crystallin family protein [Candidatus Binatia bacterium]|jgi:HSP20 family protein|nr:Hsp20/alpha crystallin family protein [Candidatus Binatia bacterium]